MTEWWSTSPESARTAGERPKAADGQEPEPWPSPPGMPPAPVGHDPQIPSEKERRKGILVGASVAAVAGLIVFSAMPGEESSSRPPAGSPASSQEEYLPPAGKAPSEAEKDTSPASRKAVQKPRPKVVKLTATRSGRGRTGIIVSVDIQNDTDDQVMLMANFVKADGHPALVGEGTLAPGSRLIEPGGKAEGTVEFAVGTMPEKVTLVDLSGNVVAAN